MANIAALDDVKHTRVGRVVPGGRAFRTNFVVPPEGDLTAPHGYLAENTPGRLLRTHFHELDQFQIFLNGGGTFGRHNIVPITVHFSRAFTPYGPIIAGENGLDFLTLRQRRDLGAYYLPDKRAVLDQMPNRVPWQVSQTLTFTESADAVTVSTLDQIMDDKGLAAYSIHMRPNARYEAVDPATGSGQYVVVFKGSLIFEGKELKSLVIGYIASTEIPLQLVAGSEGLQAIILNFPRREKLLRKSVEVSDATHFKVWQCTLCSFVYDEAAGLPDDGIAAGTRWEDVPETWTCPDCSTSKNDFQMIVVA